MEEILASIRRIIADDQDAPPRGPAAAPLPPAEPALREGAETASYVEVPRMRPRPVLAREELVSEEHMHPLRDVPPSAATPSQPEPDTLVGAEAGALVGEAFARLAATPIPQPTRTLEDTVMEMLRPMLKQWLDENLPPIVERLVRAEIERVARAPR